MKAVKEAWGKNTRIRLADVLPIKTPISVGIEASSYCNMRCSYCAHGLKEKNFPQQFMSFDTFQTAIDSLTLFDDKLKNVVFALGGEPLMNQQLPEMVRYVKKRNVSDKVTIFTNAVLLTEKYSKNLIDAGLDILRISIQGVNSERYLELCGVRLDYNTIVNQLKTFYEYRNKSGSSCHIFVKIVDQSFNTIEDEAKFYNDFGDICDQISVETIVPMRLEVDYGNMEVSKSNNLIKQEVGKSDVCSQAFYSMYVRSNGNVTPCCIVDANKLVIGNLKQENLYDIWNGEKLKQFRKLQLNKNRYLNPVCKECTFPECGMQINDKIDCIAEELYRKMF